MMGMFLSTAEMVAKTSVEPAGDGETAVEMRMHLRNLPAIAR